MAAGGRHRTAGKKCCCSCSAWWADTVQLHSTSLGCRICSFTKTTTVADPFSWMTAPATCSALLSALSYIKHPHTDNAGGRTCLADIDGLVTSHIFRLKAGHLGRYSSILGPSDPDITNVQFLAQSKPKFLNFVQEYANKVLVNSHNMCKTRNNN